VRDVLLQAAAQGCYQAYWSEAILDEALRNLISDGRMTEGHAAKLEIARIVNALALAGFGELVRARLADDSFD
jgi:hypothetical protein